MLSVIIPTYGREERLCQCLEDVLKQDRSEFETIVVDQTPRHQPDTVAFLKSVARHIRHIRLSRPSVTVACNVGARLARGEILVFLDDDIRIPDVDFLRRHAACYFDDSIGAVAGRVRDSQDPAGQRFDPRSSDPIWGWYHTTWDHDTRTDVVTAPGANMSCRKSLFTRLGGFDERFTGNAVRFENDFCLRMLQAGYRVIFEPSASVVHYYNSSGGHNNRHLYGIGEDSHSWYASYFRNMVYATLKHMPVRVWPLVLWKLWRQHVGNRPFLRAGLRCVLKRHRAFAVGVWEGLRAGKRVRTDGTASERTAQSPLCWGCDSSRNGSGHGSHRGRVAVADNPGD